MYLQSPKHPVLRTNSTILKTCKRKYLKKVVAWCKTTVSSYIKSDTTVLHLAHSMWFFFCYFIFLYKL